MSRQIEFFAREAVGWFIDARNEQVQGWVPGRNHETSKLSVPIRVWLAS